MRSSKTLRTGVCGWNASRAEASPPRRGDSSFTVAALRHARRCSTSLRCAAIQQPAMARLDMCRSKGEAPRASQTLRSTTSSPRSSGCSISPSRRGSCVKPHIPFLKEDNVTGRVLRARSVPGGVGVSSRTRSTGCDLRVHYRLADRQRGPTARVASSRLRRRHPGACRDADDRAQDPERVRAIQYGERRRPPCGCQAARHRGRDNFRDNRAKSAIRVESLKSASLCARIVRSMR